MIKAASLGIDIDLLSYSQFLKQQGLRHRSVEESGMQAIYVESSIEVQFIQQSLEKFINGKEIEQSERARSSGSAISIKRIIYSILTAFIQSPITMILIVICLTVAAISSLGAAASRVDFMFYPLIDSSSLSALIGDINSLGVAFGTLAPMFLHFGELHLVFNLLWLWYFGKQLESLQPAGMFIALVVLTSFVSNTTQYMAIEYNNFGGMSGVVYGLLGYTWIIHSLMPRSYLLINTNMFIFFVLALVLMEVVASSWIATAAHVGGLVSGVAIGIATVLFYRLILNRDVVGKNG